MKKICFQISNIELCGGTERVCAEIANGLSGRGYDVTILTLGRSSKSYFALNPQIKVIALRRNFLLYKLRYKKWLTIFLLRLFVRLYNMDIMIDVDTLLSNETLKAIRGTKCKHIAWDHYNYHFCINDKRRTEALDLIKKYSNALVVLTKADKEQYVEKEDMLVSFVSQIYNPLTFEIDKVISHVQKKVLAVGRFAMQKGFDLLLKSWKKVEDRVNDWELHIYGYNGEDTGDVFSTYDSLNLKRVKLHCSTSDIAEKFAESSIFVLSSRFEGLGIVLLEACASSLPIVSYNCPYGPSEIVKDGENGFLVEPENIDKLAESLIILILDEEKRKSMGEKSFEIAKKFSKDEVVDQWVNLIDSL